MVVLMRSLWIMLFLAVTACFAEEEETRKPDKVISVIAERFTFSPAKIKLKQGMVVELVITSDDTDHGFRIPSANINVAIPQQGKGAVRVKFVASKKGTYQFECSRPCGAGHNLMLGRIIVE